jgi:hypothetical protein
MVSKVFTAASGVFGVAADAGSRRQSECQRETKHWMVDRRKN